MNNAYQDSHRDNEPLDERLDIFFREIELAVKWQRPSILLAVYPSDAVHAEVEAALENKIIGFGQQVMHFRPEDGGNLDISLFVSQVPDSGRVIFFVHGLSSQKDTPTPEMPGQANLGQAGTMCGGERGGFDRYRALNVSREYFVEKQIRIVFWLTEAEAVSLAHFAPDFWASRHRVIDFIESQKPDETFTRVLESAWQGQGEDKHMTDNLVDTHAKISLRETTQAGLPEWDGSTTAGVNLLLTLGIMHWRKGDHDKADESLRSALEIAIKTQDKRLEAVCFNAIALVKTDLGMLDQAVEAYEQAIELAPEKTFIWGHLGNLYSQLGQYQEAVEAFLNTLEHNPVDSVAWNSLGNAYVNIGQIDEAIDAYRKALELNDRLVDPWMSLGSLFKQQNLSADAIKAYQKATELDSNNAQAWNELSNIYLELQAFDEAIEAYNIAIKLGVESGRSYCNLASAYARKDEFASAIPFYLKSIELFESDGDKAIAWNRLGDVYRQVKDYDNAISAYQQADKLAEPNGSTSTNQLGYLNSLIAGEKIVDELSTELLDQVREMAAAEQDATQPQDTAATEEHANADQPAAAQETSVQPATEPAQAEEAAESVSASEPEIEQAAAESDGVPPQVVEAEAPALESIVVEAALLGNDAVQAAEPEQTESTQAAEIVEAVAADAVLPTGDQEQSEDVPLAEETTRTDDAHIAEEISVQDAAIPADQEQASGPEIDLRNAYIWNELGNVYFKVGAYDEALDAYNKAIELGLQVGLLYSNLGFACAYKGKFAEAIPLYEKSIELLGNESDRALSWGRLADAYQHMNEFASAIAAYEKAIALDPANISFAESLNEIRDQLVQLEDAVDGGEEAAAESSDPSTDSGQAAAAQAEQAEEPAVAAALAAAETDEDDAPATQEDESDQGIVAGVVARIFEEQAVPEALSTDGGPGQPESAPITEAVAEETMAPTAQTVTEAITLEAASPVDQPGQAEAVVVVETVVAADTNPTPEQDSNELKIEEVAKEEQPATTPEQSVTVESVAPVKDLNGMREIELKNAHIWNELGHIFARASSFDDAMDAYNKAIELDPAFAWPYSNLGLVHAQKGHFGEAIPLYQKSIELFGNNKDKAISWNRLGDAYRQLNEYDNAIAAYQIADGLNQNDPESVPQDNLHEVDLPQAAPIFSYLYGGSNDRL